MGGLTRGRVDDQEQAIEHEVRRVVCPDCEAEPTKACFYGILNWGVYSHTGRYLEAQRTGLGVPALVIPPTISHHYRKVEYG